MSMCLARTLRYVLYRRQALKISILSAVTSCSSTSTSIAVNAALLMMAKREGEERAKSHGDRE
jgi:hypothetical protein